LLLLFRRVLFLFVFFFFFGRKHQSIFIKANDEVYATRCQTIKATRRQEDERTRTLRKEYEDMVLIREAIINRRQETLSSVAIMFTVTFYIQR